jgi:hypothetical protein
VKAQLILVFAVAIVVGAGAGCSARPLDGPVLDGFLPGYGPGLDGGTNGDGAVDLGDGGTITIGDGGTITTPTAPRLVAPLSAARVSSHRPTLRWDMSGVAGKASVDLCADRACATTLGTATVGSDGPGTTMTAKPDKSLSPGVVFWRVRAPGVASATWEFFVGNEDAAFDTSWPGRFDADGDGVPEIAVAGTDAVAVLSRAKNGTSAAIIQSPEGQHTGFGYVIAAAGDLNGDGYGDLAVGECGASFAFVHIFFGGPAGIATGPSQTLMAPDSQSGFGCRLAGAGDLNGDGYADLAVARTGVDFSGGLYIYYGGPGGVPTTTSRIDSPNRSPSRLGYSLAGIGDVDGDGYDDLAAAELDYSDLSGQIHVYSGGAGGIGNDHVVNLASPDPNGLQFGASVASAGDVDGDGRPDFVVGAPAVAGYAVTATAHIYYGGAGALGKSGAPSSVSDGASSTNDAYAFEVAGGGSWHGGAYDDVLIGANDAITFVDGTMGTPVAGGTVAAAGQGRNPRHFALIGDFDGDGYDDVVVTDGAGCQLIYGGAAGMTRTQALDVSAAGAIGGAVE